MTGTKHFSSKEAYRKWNAYGHMHTKTGKLVSGHEGRKSAFASTPGSQKVFIRGKLHKVQHHR